MFHPARATAAAAYVGSLIFALFAAFFGGRLRYPLVLISLVVEVLACTYFSFAVLLVCFLSSVVTYGIYTLSLRVLGVTSRIVAPAHHPFLLYFSRLRWCRCSCDHFDSPCPSVPLCLD